MTKNVDTQAILAKAIRWRPSSADGAPNAERQTFGMHSGCADVQVGKRVLFAD